MAVYIIAYDLHGSTENRKKVENSIETIGEWCKCVSTTYLIKTSLPRDSVVEIAMQYLSEVDEMVICQVDGPVSGRLKTDERNWVLDNL